MLKRYSRITNHHLLSQKQQQKKLGEFNDKKPYLFIKYIKRKCTPKFVCSFFFPTFIYINGK